MRSHNPGIKTYIDERLDSAALALPPADLLQKVAGTLIGITEQSDPALVDMIRSTIAKPWGEPWCSDFVQTCIAYVELVKAVQSPVAPSEGVLDMWNRSKAYSAAQPAQKGDIIVWRLGQTAEGHCGLITGINSLLYETVEGNTSDSADIDRMGRGVHAKKRAKGGTRTFTEVGFLRVFA